MEEFIPDFILQADNVYRTRNYYRKAKIGIYRKHGGR